MVAQALVGVFLDQTPPVPRIAADPARPDRTQDISFRRTELDASGAKRDFTSDGYLPSGIFGIGLVRLGQPLVPVFCAGDEFAHRQGCDLAIEEAFGQAFLEYGMLDGQEVDFLGKHG